MFRTFPKDRTHSKDLDKVILYNTDGFTKVKLSRPTICETCFRAQGYHESCLTVGPAV